MAVSQKLRILAPTRYPWRFNSPRESIHEISVRFFTPFNKISAKIEGITVFNPFPIKKFDLVHAFNRIPLGQTPFVIGFESHLPRAFGLEGTYYFKLLNKALVSDRCRKIIAISNYAAGIFRAFHDSFPHRDLLAQKLCVRYPNMVAPDTNGALAPPPADPLIVTFVGNHFGRKGGCVAVRMAQLARERGFPLIVQVVSKVEVGGGIWTDPPDRKLFDPYLKLLALPNVRYYQGLPNKEVLALLSRSHFSILATFSDTFGYSAIESMMHYTPVIATRQGALPEFITHGKNGILLDLPVNDLGEWAHARHGSRTSTSYAANYFTEVDRLAEQAIAALVQIVEQPGKLETMRESARLEATNRFDHKSASLFWDALYLEAVNTKSA